MADSQRFKSFGVYVSQPVFESLANRLYDDAGIVELEGYFDPSTPVVADDPGAEATDALLSELVDAFASLYDDADFAAAERVDPDGFVLVSLAANPETVTAARERFRAAALIQQTDLRTVHTALLAAQLAEAGRSE